MPYLHKSFWQYMLKESSDKFHGLKFHGFPCFPLTVFIGKRNRIVSDTFYAVIGNSDTKDISGEIAQVVLPLARIPTIHYPFLLPDVGIYVAEKLSLLHGIPEFSLKDSGKWSGVNKEILS